MGVAEGADGRPRCSWALSTSDYVVYHDEEWGFPAGDDAVLFEKLCLEGFQAGLSWITVLRKRPAFREAFLHFDIQKVAAFGDGDVERLVVDAGIIRHRGKIASTINNARRAIELQDQFGSLAAYLWRWEPTTPGSTAEATALSRDLKKRGWTFVGPTTVYAFMQAMGLVNDHEEGCWCRATAEAARRGFVRPR